MKKSHFLAAGAAATMMLGSTLASAVTIDFGTLANGNEMGYTTFTHTEGPVTVNATGSSADGNTSYFAYMDSGFGGLGVCKTLTANKQCTPSSDDNVTYGERLSLSFDQKVTISEISFISGSHGTDFLGQFDLIIDNGAATTYNLTNIFSMNLTGETFEFINPNILGGSNASNGYQFYISSIDVAPVPVPAAAWLFGSGLLGLVGVARRKTA